MTGDTPSNFWSRRRAAVAAEAETEARMAEAEVQALEEERLAARPDEEILAELDLPAPEEMDSPDQVQSLLRAAVPQRLKTRAMRRLWRLNPVLANVDGLVDYGEDFTDASTVVENLQTLYQVGKGMFDQAALDAEAEAAKAAGDKAEAAEAPDQVRGGDTSDAGPAPVDPSTTSAALMSGPTAATRAPAAAPGPHAGSAATDPEPGPAAETAPETAEAPAAASRRMRFRFETAT